MFSHDRVSRKNNRVECRTFGRSYMRPDSDRPDYASKYDHLEQRSCNRFHSPIADIGRNCARTLLHA